MVIVTSIWTKPSFSVKIEQTDVASSTASHKDSAALSLFVFETLFVFESLFVFAG